VPPEEEEEQEAEPEQVEEPTTFRPPYPYFRADGGGIYKQDGSGDEATEIKVYEYDLYPIKRVFDPNDGESIVFRLHLPQDGVKEFTVPLKRLMAGDQFREVFGGEGVAATQNQMKEIMNYTIKFTKELQRLHRAHQAQLQFGWTEDREKFIVGNRAYCKGQKTEHNPASSTTADLIRYFTPKGVLEEWREAFNVLARPGMEALQLVAGAGLARPDGEMMRLIEMHVDRVYVEDADITFEKMNDNFGLAAEVYVPWLVDNKDKIPELYDKQRDRIYKVIDKRMEERFWVGTLAMILVGLRIAQKLGLHDYDLDALEIWVCEYLMGLRGEVKSEVVMADNLVGEFLMDNSNGILAVGNRINPRSGDNIWMPSRSSKLIARFELDENRMYIAKKSFREYCVDRQFTETEALKESAREGSTFRYLKTVKKRMMAGTAITAPGVDAHVFQCDPEEAEALFSALEKKVEQDDLED